MSVSRRRIVSLLATAALTGMASLAGAQSAPVAAPGSLLQKTAPAPGAPNILVVLLDDVGFSASSSFGGSIHTPNFDRLVRTGVPYNRFNTTAICSPSRAALLSGRNHHQTGFGNLSNYPGEGPGYTTMWSPATATVARMLQDRGYSTGAFGKWHNTPTWEVSAVGPFKRWPTGLGFDHFFGFQGGSANQYQPDLYNDATLVTPSKTPEEGYTLTSDLVDKAITWVDDHDAIDATRPYFMYFATGATHMPHHVPESWIKRYRGRFDMGWDKYREQTFERQKRAGIVPRNAVLTPRPSFVRPWSSLSADERKVYNRHMEVYAGFLEQTDAEVGRLIDTLRARPGGDNLMIVYVFGDNGGSSEGTPDGAINSEVSLLQGAPNDLDAQAKVIDQFGGPELMDHYPAGWGWAMNTPFSGVKQMASNFGGTRVAMVVNWPGHTGAPGQMRTQFSHLNDIAPTLLDVAGVPFPDAIDGVKQLPFEGSSLRTTFNDPHAAEHKSTQYFEIFGNRGIYKDGWFAGASRRYPPWQVDIDVQRMYKDDWKSDTWELYNLDNDFSQAKDLAGRYPAKLAMMRAEFDKEAQRNNVFPLLGEARNVPNRIDPRRTSFTYYPGTHAFTPNVFGRPHRFTVSIEGNAAAASGVLIAQGGQQGGYALYVKDGLLVFDNNDFGHRHDLVSSTRPLTKGAAELGFEFVPAANNAPRSKPTGGTIRLMIDGAVVGEGKVDRFPTTMGAISPYLDIGQDHNSTVSQAREEKLPYNGVIKQVRLDLR